MRVIWPAGQSLMRRPVLLAPILAHRWEPTGAPGIELLPLNHDPRTGARTALIRSIARPGFACKAQFHHCEEEFLCLEGLFTFDGLHWMRPLSYAYYPPHVVHGARVSVPSGYLLYLRTSGSTEAFPVAEPITSKAYHHPDSREREPIVVLERPLEPEPAAPLCQSAQSRIRRHVLRTQPEKAAVVTLWEFGAGERDIFRHFPAATPLEVLIASTDIGSDGLQQGSALTYGCYGSADVRPTFDPEVPIFALVHAGLGA